MKKRSWVIISIFSTLLLALTVVVLLTGVSGFGCRPADSCRDKKRVADIKIIQNYLELYNSRFGHYPGDFNGKITADIIHWDQLKITFSNVIGIQIPQDPLPKMTYYYATNKENSAYIIGAILEKENIFLKRSDELDSIEGFITPPGMTCDDKMLGYCVGN